MNKQLSLIIVLTALLSTAAQAEITGRDFFKCTTRVPNGQARLEFIQENYDKYKVLIEYVNLYDSSYYSGALQAERTSFDGIKASGLLYSNGEKIKTGIQGTFKGNKFVGTINADSKGIDFGFGNPINCLLVK